uniref:Uncharacterized protein n=1 Tax=Pristionchus pacificus TaxID=54126 RepID=A0A2A6D3L9_PRIPA|eukprot:PDM84877.1 hypothetical protein PRIPAC_33900 [Pristionchus pacificus]
MKYCRHKDTLYNHRKDIEERLEPENRKGIEAALRGNKIVTLGRKELGRGKVPIVKQTNGT